MILFLSGFAFAVAVVVFCVAYRVNRARENKCCTACRRRYARRLVGTLDLETGTTRLGALCTACAEFSDKIGPPPWAE